MGIETRCEFLSEVSHEIDGWFKVGAMSGSAGKHILAKLTISQDQTSVALLGFKSDFINVSF